jgi:glycosyltransferase involved in cell wall biosynthesis
MMRDRTTDRLTNVLHVIDSLEVGGAERVAVNLVNHLPRDTFTTHLCTTRSDGPLADLLAPDVGRLSLNRRSTLEIRPVRRLATYVDRHEIDTIHAHGSAAFVSSVATLLHPRTRLVWHVHYGRYATAGSRGWPFRVLRSKVDHVIAVNEALAEWARRRVRFAPDDVSYIPNFTELLDSPVAAPCAPLPGAPGERIVCVANIVPEKDHLTLVRAMARVVERRPGATLLLAGSSESNPRCAAVVRREVDVLGLRDRVHLLGQRRDVAAVLRGCDVAVLSSRAEGLPLALLEYGAMARAVVVTDAGQCADVVSDTGVVVPPTEPEALARALAGLLDDPDRAARGLRLQARVREHFSVEVIVRRVAAVYERVLGRGAVAPQSA